MSPEADCDYVIVGSGAGGGTLATRLAEAGMRVVLLEAGGDAGDTRDARLPEDYEVPAFHPFASENPAMRWDFFVRHYTDERMQRRDAKYVADRGGIFYPRAGTLGGCTAHNAMIFVAPHNGDWDGIADLTGDQSWRASRMQQYWEKVENCRHRPVWRELGRLGVNPTGHGWAGWLESEWAKPSDAFADSEVRRLLLDSALAVTSTASNPLGTLNKLFHSEADPNDRRFAHAGFEGICYTPLSTKDHRRVGARERVLDVAASHPDRLRVELHALATQVIFDEHQRAIGVDYLKGAHLYRADPVPSADSGAPQRLLVRREVILAGGAFNTPQLLMLSGIGAAAALQPHGIAVRVDLPGVGRNLQDRYEIGVVNRLKQPWSVLAGARFEKDDPLYRQWRDQRSGMYVSNGAAVAAAQRSQPRRLAPDLFYMALLARFYGYFPGYSRQIAEHHDYLTWAILKAHTNNRAGTVALRSADPRDTPIVDFHYFDERDDPGAEDLHAVIAGIRFARALLRMLNQPEAFATEELPGTIVETDEELGAYVRDNAWGHHASCSCAIGPRKANGVLDSRFRVHGTQGLRVVDASAFPRIPGFFIVSAVYMIAEKAADAILADAATAPG